MLTYTTGGFVLQIFHLLLILRGTSGQALILDYIDPTFSLTFPKHSGTKYIKQLYSLRTVFSRKLFDHIASALQQVIVLHPKCTAYLVAIRQDTAAFTLDVYGHVTEQMKKESAARMEQFIKAVNK